ncbi:hypothetical protein AVEN_235132-1, partial [Araneus ventricosus]
PDCEEKINCRPNIQLRMKLGYNGEHFEEKTLAAEYEAVVPCRKKMKNRATILGCANASGSHSVKLTLVGKSKTLF